MIRDKYQFLLTKKGEINTTVLRLCKGLNVVLEQ